MKFNVLVKIKLQQKGITQSDLARILGVSRGYISDIVTGKRQGGKYRQQIIELLEIPPDYEKSGDSFVITLK